MGLEDSSSCSVGCLIFQPSDLCLQQWCVVFLLNVSDIYTIFNGGDYIPEMLVSVCNNDRGKLLM